MIILSGVVSPSSGLTAHGCAKYKVGFLFLTLVRFVKNFSEKELYGVPFLRLFIGFCQDFMERVGFLRILDKTLQLLGFGAAILLSLSVAYGVYEICSGY